jgi:hypothetical protein
MGAAKPKIEVYIYDDNTEPVRFMTRGRGSNGICISVEPDRESAVTVGAPRKGGVNISSMGTIGPMCLGRVQQMMTYALAIYARGVEHVDELLTGLEEAGVEVHDHRGGNA